MVKFMFVRWSHSIWFKVSTGPSNQILSATQLSLMYKLETASMSPRGCLASASNSGGASSELPLKLLCSQCSIYCLTVLVEDRVCTWL